MKYSCEGEGPDSCLSVPTKIGKCECRPDVLLNWKSHYHLAAFFECIRRGVFGGDLGFGPVRPTHLADTRS